ncbi:glycosyltransferase family A protein [Uliginosibacterium sp. 31-16]|uniref:glycosyltransferase family A protein n=1 Tax=Uliginosibacterium sp. 31-16 TaxID=3068315 RepID=UPI00273F941A|nr:glycosyltransferase family A protein [Uliginosibacterium sp. 31-16]MDP5238381.1 glycosyltransferase family A protein [Uliginosibacterium sp. 31-16]
MNGSHRSLFTVFTPTYNRAAVLYDSLCAQTCRDFEWLIVDDGSTDDTRELVARWQSEAGFSIHYVWQKNGHKKTAMNRGAAEARGELFLTLDSDDACLPDARRNAAGLACWARQALSDDFGWFRFAPQWFVRMAINWGRFSLHDLAARGVALLWPQGIAAWTLCALCFPVGAALAWRDRACCGGAA